MAHLTASRSLSKYKKRLVKRFAALLKTPLFIGLTILVHGGMLLGASLLYFLEKASNDSIHSFLDCVYWSMSTLTSTGYGDIVPNSDLGKILAVLMMACGTLLTPLYTALFATIILTPELLAVEDKVMEIEQEMKNIHTK